MSNFNVNIPTKKRPGTIIFLVVFLLILIYKMAGKTIINWNWIFIIVVPSIVVIYLCWILFGLVSIKLKEQALIVKKSCLKIPFSIRKFNVLEIKNIHVAHNTNANTWWSPMGGGITTPKYLRVYDKNPTVIYFNYKEKQIKIGEGLEEFNARLILTEIHERQSVASNS